MSTSIAINTATNAVATAAAAEASRAKDIACKALLSAYKPEGATVSEMRKYADCVHRMYPQPMSDGLSVVLKVAILVLIASFVVGCFYERGNFFDRFLGGGLMFLTVAVAAMVLLAFAVGGVLFVFS
jgi:hypothetical protein